MSKKFDSKFIVRQGVVAALYAVLTVLPPLSSLSYGPLQFRVSEVLTLLAFFNPEYIWGLTIGCFVANLFSPYILDMVVGTFASFIAVFLMSKCKNIYIASIMPAIANILIGVQIFVLSKGKEAFFLVTGQIMLSEIIVVSVIGIIIFKILVRNKTLVEILQLNRKNILY